MDGKSNWDTRPQSKRGVELVYQAGDKEKGGTMKHYLIRHNSGEYFVVQAWTIARLRKLIETECHDRGWDVDDTETIEIEKQEAVNERW